MQNVLVTGGASFIGSHLVDRLVQKNVSVTVIDDLSSGKIENLSESIDSIKFINSSVMNIRDLRSSLESIDTVFHLAAVHGGRGYIETYPDRILENLSIDNHVFYAAAELGVSRVIHASSACVYPVTLQEDEKNRDVLVESEANFEIRGGAFPDGVYGWTKLMGELQLKTLSEKNYFSGRSARIFTAYGSRENESHAAVALIAKALLRIDPFPIWGNGQQTRNFTHVFDTVEGLIHLAEDQSRERFLAVNVGNSSHYTVLEFVSEVFRQLGWQPETISFELDRPTGVKSRAASNVLMSTIAHSWEPTIGLAEGIAETMNWYNTVVFPTLDQEELTSRLVKR